MVTPEGRTVTDREEATETTAEEAEDLTEPPPPPSTIPPSSLFPIRREDLMSTIPYPLPKPPQTLNTTTIPQTIINELNSESLSRLESG